MANKISAAIRQRHSGPVSPTRNSPAQPGAQPTIAATCAALGSVFPRRPGGDKILEFLGGGGGLSAAKRFPKLGGGGGVILLRARETLGTLFGGFRNLENIILPLLVLF